MRLTTLAIATALLASPVLADEVTGTIIAYDRQANVIVFNDRTIWELGALMVPGDLAAGDRVTLVYTSNGDNGIGKADSLTRAE